MKKLISLLILVAFCILMGSYFSYNKKIEAAGEQALKKYHEQQAIELQIKKEKVDSLYSKVSAVKYEANNFMNMDNSLSENLLDGEKLKIVFLGDSTTEQNKYTGGKDGHVNIIKETFQSIFPNQVVVVNSGISGNTSADMLERLEKDVIAHRPDYVVVSTGINDSLNPKSIESFEKNIGTIVEDISLKSNAKIILRTTNPTLNTNSNLIIQNEINSVIKKIAREKGFGFIDFFSEISKLTEENKYDREQFMTDTHHPNAMGQKEIADMVLYGLLIGSIKE